MSEHLVLNKTDDLNETLNTDKLKDSVYYNRIPTKLKKTFYFVMILLIIGLTLFSIGIYFSIIDDEVQDMYDFAKTNLKIYIKPPSIIADDKLNSELDAGIFLD